MVFSDLLLFKGLVKMGLDWCHEESSIEKMKQWRIKLFFWPQGKVAKIPARNFWSCAFAKKNEFYSMHKEFVEVR